jgi:hypothetical protein
MKLCGFDVLSGHDGAQRLVTKSGNPLCDKSHVELSLRDGLAQHLTESVEL